MIKLCSDQGAAEFTFDVLDLLLCDTLVLTLGQSISEKNKSLRGGSIFSAKIVERLLMNDSATSVKLGNGDSEIYSHIPYPATDQSSPYVVAEYLYTHGTS